jgi:hypothetical protein
MNIIRNDTLIKRNARIAQITMIGGLLVLAGGMFISFRYPEQFGFSLGALMLGFLLSQVGIFFTNRWGRRPRPDELLAQALKGMDKKYTLYNYSGPTSHMLVGPAGVWVLMPYYQKGTITYDENKGRWNQKGGNLYLKIFAQESLGRPDLEAGGELDRVQKFLSQKLPEDASIPVHVALVFTHPDVEINIPEDSNTPAEAVQASKLKDLIRKVAKSDSISLEKVQMINDAVLSE